MPLQKYNNAGKAVDLTPEEMQAIVKELGLGHVDNTADMDKPISTAMQAALDAVPHSFMNIDADYAEKRRGNGTTYIVRLNDGLLNQGGTWANRTTLNYI